MSEGTFEMAQDDGFDAAVDAAVTAATGGTAVAEPEPVVEAVPEEAVEEKPERERDEQGRYKAAEIEELPEGAEEELPPAAVIAEPDTLEALRAQFEARLADKDEFIGRLSNEVGELRQQQRQPTPTPVNMDALADAIADRPSLGETYAAQALQAGDWNTYDAVIDAWAEVDSRGARQYERRVNVWLAEQTVAAKTAPYEQTAQANQRQQAVTNLAGKYDDFPQVIATLEQEGSVPDTLDKAVRNAPSQAAYEEALDTLYHFLKGKQAGPLAAVVKQASEEDREATRQAKLDATVATASASPVREEPKTIQEQIVEEWKTLDAPFADPWSHA